MNPKDSDKNIVIYTDGSCYPNPDGEGGWAFYYKYRGTEVTKFGYASGVTNNHMELTAIYFALLFVPTVSENRTPLVIVTDSSYCKNALTKWWEGWASNGWRNSTGRSVSSKSLIKAMILRLREHELHRKVTFLKVKGHSGVPENEHVDQQASIARKDRATNWTTTNKKA